MDIKGFKSRDGSVHQYDYESLANKPEKTSGEDGGYYTPAVTQPDDETVQFDFTPSKVNMPAVEPVQVKLPVPDSSQNVDLSGYVSKEELPEAINTALAQAKVSGEFDGADGEDGYTPVRGTDYWTDADKAEIKSYVDTAILGGAW